MTSRFEDSILQSLRRISRALDLYSRRLTAESNLTVPQLLCLRHLSLHGPTTPKSLAVSLSLSQATITGILQRLQSRDLIAREPHPNDKRSVSLRLTDSGRALLDAAPPALDASFSSRLADLPEGEQAMYDWALTRIAALMSEDGQD